MTIQTSRASASADGRMHFKDRSIDLGIRFSYDELQDETRKARSQKKYLEVEQAYKERTFKEAYDDCERALKENPNDISRLLQKSQLLEHKGKSREGLAILDYILQIDPGDSRSLYWKAFALARLNDIEKPNESLSLEELHCYELLLRIDPNDTEVLYLAGELLAGLGRYEEAIEYYEKALDWEPGYLSALRSKAEALFKLGRLSEALQLYEKHLTLSPRSTHEMFMIGIIFARSGKYLDAIEMMRRALFSGSSLDAQFILPYLRYKIGDFQAARLDIRAIRNQRFNASNFVEEVKHYGFDVDEGYCKLCEETPQ